MENKTIHYDDILKRFRQYTNLINEIPFDKFYSNEEISHNQFKDFFDYFRPTLPILDYIEWLRTANPDVTIPYRGSILCRLNDDGMKVVKFNSWVGYYSEMKILFEKDLSVQKSNLANYKLIYSYAIRLKNCVRIIDDFFLMFTPANYLTPIYKNISHELLCKLISLVGFYGEYILSHSKNDGRIYIRPVNRNNQIYNIGTANPNLPVRASLEDVRGGEGITPFPVQRRRY